MCAFVLRIEIVCYCSNHQGDANQHPTIASNCWETLGKPAEWDTDEHKKDTPDCNPAVNQWRWLQLTTVWTSPGPSSNPLSTVDADDPAVGFRHIHILVVRPLQKAVLWPDPTIVSVGRTQSTPPR